MMYDISHDKKERIYKIAKSIFAKYGYSRTTMDDIAKVIGMKKNSLYYYFPSKEAIFEEVIKRESETCFNETLKDTDSEKTAYGKVKKFVLSGLHHHREMANLHNVTTEAILDIKYTIENSYQKLVKRQVDLLTKIIDEGIKNKEFRKINSAEVAGNIMSLVNSIEFKEFCRSRDEFYKKKNFSLVDRKIIALLDLILEGLKIK